MMKEHKGSTRVGLRQTWVPAPLTAWSCHLCLRYLTSLRGHVSAVYQIAWSADSRLLVSGSSDSTLKVWNAETKKLAIDLPGHADEVSVQSSCGIGSGDGCSFQEAGLTGSLFTLGFCNRLEPRRTEGSEWREG